MSLENIVNYVNTIELVAQERGERYAETYQRTSYAYAFGFISSNFKYCLEALNLSEEQLKILEERTQWIKEKGMDY